MSMMIVVIVALTIIFFLFARLRSLKRQLKQMTKQLVQYNQQETEKKIDIALIDSNLELLAVETNRLIDTIVDIKASKRRTENELKQAVSNMSHDLRTPLTSIIGYIQMAESDDVTVNNKKEYLSTAKKRSKRLETMLNGFFELSVIEATDYRLKSERVNIKSLSTDTVLSFYDRFNEKQIEPHISLSDNDLFIIADESAAMRVIENLISNAITYADGNISIHLEEKNETAILTISNDAPALTEEDVNLFFDRFYMADQTRSGKNTGLGLSIVKSLMLKMDGTITTDLKDGHLSIVCKWQTT